MVRKKTQRNLGRLEQVLAEAQRSRELRSVAYRDQALKLFPWICARCGREFSGKKLQELTVHHKDHNHDNNPPDGSNWELLCGYCHDMEHARFLDEGGYDDSKSFGTQDSHSTYKPFAGLQELLKDKKK
ncbi:MAG: YajD family HNH nuclease [Pseudomonadota bacterium]